MELKLKNYLSELEWDLTDKRYIPSIISKMILSSMISIILTGTTRTSGGKKVVFTANDIIEASGEDQQNYYSSGSEYKLLGSILIITFNVESKVIINTEDKAIRAMSTPSDFEEGNYHFDGIGIYNAMYENLFLHDNA